VKTTGLLLFNGTGEVSYAMSYGGAGDHVLSLGFERIYSTAKRGFLLVQHYVRTLDELRYDVCRDTGMKRFNRIHSVANVGGVANVAGA